MSIERKLIGTVDAASGPAVYVEDVFSTWLYTGNGSSQTITNGIDLATKGGLIWIKNRSAATYPGHFLFDTNRGQTFALRAHTQDAQEAGFAQNFSTSGFSLGGDGYTNQSNQTYASWTFRKQAKFFDVVTYTGTGSARTISHALGSTPGMIIVKRTDTTGNWQVYHRSLTSAANSIQLNLTNAQASATTVWNSTAPTSSVFSVGTDATVNASGGTYVAYLFAHDAGGFGLAGTDSVVSCGSYTGNGSAAGPTVNLGWEPQFLLIKNTANGSAPWEIADTIRGLSLTGQNRLFANNSNAEDVTATPLISINSTGFTLSAANSFLNGNGQSHIYLAIRRGPMKTPTDATKVFAPVAYTGEGAGQSYSAGFPVDKTIVKSRTNATASYEVWDRLRGASEYLKTNSTDAGSTFSGQYKVDSNTNVTWAASDSWSNSGGSTYATYNFRRAPGFFDVVCYTGDGASSRSISHNLAVSPNLIIWKARSIGSTFWRGWSSEFPTQYFAAFAASSFVSGSYISANSTTFSYSLLFGDDTNNTAGVTYVAYLFASCPGVSKVGSYTGNGSSQTIDCGFTNGARFVLIKRTDSTGSWWVYDSARGIVSANDPALQLNSTAAEVTSADAVDPASSGFIVNQEATCNINVSSATYIYLSVA